MKIAFDISQTGSAKAGCGYLAFALAGLLPQVAPEHEYYFLQSFGDFFFDAQISGRAAQKNGGNLRTGPVLHNRQAAEQFWNSADLEAELGKPDIIHSNNFWCPIQLTDSRLIYTLYDLSFLENPDWTTEANRIGCLEGVFRAAAVADWIVSISEYSRDHFLQIFPHFPPQRLKVIYPASRFADTECTGQQPAVCRHLQPDKFWLSVGTIEPRKNQKMLAQAFARYLAAGKPAMPLVFAGGSGWMMDDFARYLEELGIAEQVVITGYVSDEELIWLYRNCYANLYPSFFEGFGLPVLEGMQFGAATAASTAASLPEVTGDAALSIAPDNLEGWVAALEQMADSPALRQHLKCKAVKRAELFNWHNSLQQWLLLYREAFDTPLRRNLQTR